MALINKIRERSGIAVVVIAVALLLFIVGGDIFSGNSKYFGGDKNSVGEIAGTSIDYQQFQKSVEVMRENYQAQSGKAPTEAELAQIREQAWQQMIFDVAYKKEFDALGMKVTPDELREMIQGKNLSPQIMQQFTDPKTGQFNRENLNTFITAAANNQLQPQQKVAWDNFKAQLMKYRMNEKYEALFSKSNYVTSSEAKKEYEAQVARADVNYLVVPFNSIVDSTIKVTDSQLSDYLSKHKNEYQGYDSRSFEYIAMPIAPSKEDSATTYEEIKRLAKGLAAAPNDSVYALSNSDTRVPYQLSLTDMPATLKAAVATAIPGSVIGPFKEGNTYSIHKIDGTVRDTNYTARASHILIRADKTAPDSVKAAARAKAQSLLDQIKKGANFEQLAAANGSDGTAQQGGDLGYFKNNGSMVKPFEQAIFGYNGVGLLPNLVETDFGYHIVKVTEAKSNTKYKIATITRTLIAGESTRNTIYQKADELRASTKTKEAFEAAAKKDKLIILQADKVAPGANSFNTIQSAREVVLWAFNKDTKLNTVSNKVFEIGDQYVIAVLTGETDKNAPKADDFKNVLTAQVRKEIKTEQISKKLASTSGTLEQIAQKYGAGALVETANDINMQVGPLGANVGTDPLALGKTFGTKIGTKTKPFAGENGVIVLEPTKITPAPVIADYTQYKQQIQQRTGGSMSYLINEAIKDAAKVQDNRTKFF